MLKLPNKIYIWWLKREFYHQIQCLEKYLEGSAFDLDLSPYEYRRRLELLRGRVRQTAIKLIYQDIDVYQHKEHLKWR